MVGLSIFMYELSDPIADMFDSGSAFVMPAASRKKYHCWGSDLLSFLLRLRSLLLQLYLIRKEGVCMRTTIKLVAKHSIIPRRLEILKT